MGRTARWRGPSNEIGITDGNCTHRSSHNDVLNVSSSLCRCGCQRRRWGRSVLFPIVRHALLTTRKAPKDMVKVCVRQTHQASVSGFYHFRFAPVRLGTSMAHGSATRDEDARHRHGTFVHRHREDDRRLFFGFGSSRRACSDSSRPL